MQIIEAFGGKISALAETDPEKAKRLLLLGWRANGLKNRVKHKGISGWYYGPLRKL